MHRRKMALEHGYESAKKYINQPGVAAPSNTLNPKNDQANNLEVEKKKSSQMSHFAYSSSDPADPFKAGLAISQQQSADGMRQKSDGNPNLETSPSI